MYASMQKYIPTENDLKKIENNFTYHPPLPDQVARYEQIRQEGKRMAEFLTAMCPPSRELSLALTNLEQALFWANAAIARNEKDTSHEE